MDGGTSTTAQAAHASPGLSLIPQSPKPIGSPNTHAPNDQTVTQWGRQATASQVQDEAEAHGDVEEEPRNSTTDSKMRTRPRMTIDLSADPMDVLFDRKLSIDDPSPKPCIVPGNALHLIDDDPSPRSQTPSSVIVLEPDDAASAHNTDADRSSSEPPPPRPAPRVRFRSRVRITSGVHHHHRAAHSHANATPCSSASDSPSSSISAPLRYQADENAAWGPLGKRLSAYASTGGWQKLLNRHGLSLYPPTLTALLQYACIPLASPGYTTHVFSICSLLYL
ncbi:hypothetical protein B0H21DRAFT_114744 [Amylocystis lapponica]|nr:hypothetical protein B0H21DRAFT_114744 [Amylocystis lapponica]